MRAWFYVPTCMRRLLSACPPSCLSVCLAACLPVCLPLSVCLCTIKGGGKSDTVNKAFWLQDLDNTSGNWIQNDDLILRRVISHQSVCVCVCGCPSIHRHNTHRHTHTHTYVYLTTGLQSRWQLAIINRQPISSFYVGKPRDLYI